MSQTPCSLEPEWRPTHDSAMGCRFALSGMAPDSRSASRWRWVVTHDASPVRPSLPGRVGRFQRVDGSRFTHEISSHFSGMDSKNREVGILRESGTCKPVEVVFQRKPTRPRTTTTLTGPAIRRKLVSPGESDGSGRLPAERADDDRGGQAAPRSPVTEFAHSWPDLLLPAGRAFFVRRVFVGCRRTRNVHGEWPS